jgi:cellobiose dehydrogenase (acceptor)
MSTDAPNTPSSPSTAFSAHTGSGGQGIGVYAFSQARSADYDTWAALASDATPGNGSGPGNSTTPSNSTLPIGNVTAPVSNVTYDYIVVGGGGSGIIAAQRLVETGKSVLLLERGKESYYPSGGDLTVSWNDTVSIYEVPAMYNWLTDVPGNDALCDDTPEMAGCILGGGTAVNGLAFIRPPTWDFDDNWPQGWKWSDVEASAERWYERNPGTLLPSADGKYYDYGVYDNLSKNLLAGGWNSTDTNEYPDDKEKTFSYAAVNVLNGKRAGPVATYLPLAMAETNFKLMVNTMVLRAVRTNSTITGVEVQLEDNSRMIINVNQGGKVILASGAMSSPRILFRSGIGPSDQINKVKSGTTSITLPDESVWINSPVGFVKDHTNIPVSFKVTTGMKIMSESDYVNPSQENIDLWDKASGPLTESSIMRLNSYNKVTVNNQTLIVQTHNYATTNDTINTLFVLTHGTTSSGTLGIDADGNTLWESSPYLQTDTDKEAMAMVIDMWLEMSRRANSTLQYVGSANDTGADIVANVASSAGCHMIGTTIMGTDDGSKGGNSVVDTNGQVYGTDNLFVIDAGMHADIPTGNTQAIVGVVAEHVIQKIIALGSGSSTGNATVIPADTGASALPSQSQPGPASFTFGGYSAASTLLTVSRTSAAAEATSVASVANDAAATVVSQIATAVESAVLTSVIPTALPTAIADVTGPLPEQSLPEGFTMKDLLDWIAYIMRNSGKGHNRKRRHRS